jgi:sucrose phosphorylase
MGRGVHLLAYADRFGGDLPGLRELLERPPFSVFSGVHVLPFFVPFDGPDAGFDPVDHTAVDPRLGSWADVAALGGAGLETTADLVVNHVSAQSESFRDWLARGDESPFAGMFLTFDAVFPGGAGEEQITAIYRPRAGLPFTPYEMADGTRRLVWTSFLPSQVDLDVDHPATHDYLVGLLRCLARAGVATVRLDAVGYAVKQAGTSSFMTPATLDFVRTITALAHREGLRVLVEVHAHYAHQVALAECVDLVYDFALPPVLLHSLGRGTVDRLTRWMGLRPANAVTVLDTHDGIGVVDAGPDGDRPGLLDRQEMRAIFEDADRVTHGESRLASTPVAWAELPHQVNSTFYSVLGEDDQSYLLARAVQLFTPGVPQVYYVGLLAGRNDMELFQRTGIGRDVNRHHYERDEVAEALGRAVVRAQLNLIRLRSLHPAFDGAFDYRELSATAAELRWTHHAHHARLRVDLAARQFSIVATDPARPGAGALAADSIADLVDLPVDADPPRQRAE